MDILAEYKECLCRIVTIQNETQANHERIKLLTSDLAKSEEKISKLKIQMHTASESQINQKLQQMISEQRNAITGELDSIQMEIEQINAECTNKKQSVINSINLSQYKSEMDLISRASDVLSRGKPVIQNQVPPEILTSIQTSIAQDSSQYDIGQLITRVNQTLEALPFITDESLFKYVIDCLMLDTETFSGIKPRARLAVYLLWCITFILILVYLPVVFVVPYVGLMFSSIFANNRYLQKLIAVCYPYLLLDRSILDLRSDLDHRIDILRGQQFNQINDERDSKISALEQKYSQLQAKLNSVEFETKRSLSPEEIIAKVQSDYQERINAEMESQSNINTALKRINKYNESNSSQLELAILKKEELKQKVHDYYLNPTEPGKSKLLTTSFFLGMDDNEELIEFNYRGESTLVIYKGDNNTVNTPLITMMLMQLLASMSIISLQLAITDIRNACTGYAQFSPEKLSNRIRLCATDESVSEVIDLFHTELLTRTTTILTNAPSIHEFNQQMLQRKSLTREYYILFIQDPEPKLLGSQKFLQLCRSGPIVGIIPIVFLSHLAISSMRSESPQVLLSLIEFFECTRNNTFTFNGKSQDINQDLASANQIIDDFRRALIK